MSRSEQPHNPRVAWLQCRHCRAEFLLDAPGTRHRNHCPWCLWSMHVDDAPGDRAAACRGGMEPVAVQALPDGEWRLVHQCRACHVVRINRIASDDDERTLLALAVRPLRHAPFPL